MARPSFMSPIYAWFRQGGKEVGQALPALPTSIRPVEEVGTLGNPTQQLATEQIRGKSFGESLQGYADRAQGISETQRQQARQEQADRE
jgi:hypothetical protein